MSSPSVKRACDSCHRRKVKCISEDSMPCKNCRSANLSCTYNAIPQKKGPKGSRAKVLSELRETQRQVYLSPLYDVGMVNGRSMSPPMPRTPGLLTAHIIHTCTEFFFAEVYPSQPILCREQLHEYTITLETNLEAYCLLSAFCAAMLLQPWSKAAFNPVVGSPGSGASFQTGSLLLDETLRARKFLNQLENPSLLSILGSYFIFTSSSRLDRQQLAWYHLREATTQAMALGLDREDTYEGLDCNATVSRRNLFWLLYLSERVYALQKHRPVTLQPTIRLPPAGDCPSEAHANNGFIQLINLYRLLDSTFFGMWNKTIPSGNPAWLIKLQTQLAECLPSYVQPTAESQAVDLNVSQQWLRILVWQLALSQRYVSSQSNDMTLTFEYPIEVSKDLVNMSSQFSTHAMEVHGIGLVEKLFDIACTLADVMACVQLPQSTYDPAPRTYLARFQQLISTLGGGQNRYSSLLAAKIDEVLPGMSLPISQGSQPKPIPTTGSPFESSYGSSDPSSISGEVYDEPPVQVSGAMMFANPPHSSPVDHRPRPFPPTTLGGLSYVDEDVKPKMAPNIFAGMGAERGSYVV